MMLSRHKLMSIDAKIAGNQTSYVDIRKQHFIGCSGIFGLWISNVHHVEKCNSCRKSNNFSAI